MAGFSTSWALDRQFTPEMDDATRKAKVEGWNKAVRKTLED
jgi:glycerol kinase